MKLNDHNSKIYEKSTSNFLPLEGTKDHIIPRKATRISSKSMATEIIGLNSII